MPSTARRDAARARELQVVQLRAQGLPFAQIAERLGYADQAGAHKAFTRAIRKALAEQQADRAELAQLELERLDWVIRCLAPTVESGDPRAAHAVLAAIDRRTRLLDLEAPQRAEVTFQHAVPGSEEERRRQLAAVTAEVLRRRESGQLPDAEALLSGSAGASGQLDP